MWTKCSVTDAAFHFLLKEFAIHLKEMPIFQFTDLCVLQINVPATLGMKLKSRISCNLCTIEIEASLAVMGKKLGCFSCNPPLVAPSNLNSPVASNL